MTSKNSHVSHINRRQVCTQGLGLWGWFTVNSVAAQSVTRAVRSTPPELVAFSQAASPWQFSGMGALRFFGFKAYDAILWMAGPAANPFLAKSLFALEIEYNVAVKAEEIINVSLVEMARLRRLTDAQVKSWTTEMQKAFPSVVSGDRLTGVYVPKVGTRFFLNGRLISEINDPAFGDAFFAIWLDEGTKRPDLRRSLLGSTAAVQPAAASN